MRGSRGGPHPRRRAALAILAKHWPVDANPPHPLVAIGVVPTLRASGPRKAVAGKMPGSALARGRDPAVSRCSSDCERTPASAARRLKFDTGARGAFERRRPTQDRRMRAFHETGPVGEPAPRADSIGAGRLTPVNLALRYALILSGSCPLKRIPRSIAATTASTTATRA